MESYLLCGYAFLLDRESPHRRTTVAMAIGSAVSRAAKADNLAKIDDRTMSLSEFPEVAVAAYEAETRDAEIEASALEVARGKDGAAGASVAYAKHISPRIRNVVAAEYAYCARVSDTIEIVGTPDTVTLAAVRDTKTGQEWTQDRADRSRQLTGYAILHDATYHEPPRRLAIDTIYRAQGDWRATTIWTHRAAEDRTRFVRTVEAVDGAVRAGVFLPPSEKSWKCSQKWCPHWASCPVRPGGK